MKSVHRIAAVAFVGLVAFVATAEAQRRGGMRAGAPRYDTSTEVTLRGTVQEVKQIKDWMGMRQMAGTHVILQTDQETIEVHLGPSAYVTEQKVSFQEGDEIEVVGSRVKYADANVILAREIQKDDQLLTLRDAQGIPKWAGGPRP